MDDKDINIQNALEADDLEAAESTNPQLTSAESTTVDNHVRPSRPDSGEEQLEPDTGNSLERPQPAPSGKIGANPKYAKTSTFRKTARGKKNSSLNPLNHGLYSHVVPEDERPEFNAVRRALWEQLSPATALQEVAFERIVESISLCKKAGRSERECLDAVLAPPDEQKTSAGNSDELVVTNPPYASGRKPRQECLSLLNSLERNVREQGGVAWEAWKGPLSQCFGPEFFDLLAQWTQKDGVELFFTRHHDALNRTFNFPGPEEDDEEDKEKNEKSRAWDKEMTDRLPGLEQRFEMILKLIAEKRRHLLEIGALVRTRGSEGANTGERTYTVRRTPLSLTAASRDLQQAVGWYLWLRDNNL